MKKFKVLILIAKGFPRWHSGNESSCQYRCHGFDPWVRKISWRRKWKSSLVFLPGESHGQRGLPGVHGVTTGGQELATEQQQ